MTPENKVLQSFVSLVQNWVDELDAYAKYKSQGEPGKARDKAADCARTKEKVKQALPECRAILSADQMNLFEKESK